MSTTDTTTTTDMTKTSAHEDAMRVWRSLWTEQLRVAGPAFLKMVAGEDEWEPTLALAAISAASLLDGATPAEAVEGLGGDLGAPLDDELAELLASVVAATVTPAGRDIVERTVDGLDLDGVRFVPAPEAQDLAEDGMESVVEVAAAVAFADPERAERVGARLDAMMRELADQVVSLTPDLDAPDELPAHLSSLWDGDDDVDGEAPALSPEDVKLLAEEEMEEQLRSARALAAALALPSYHPAAALLRAVEATLDQDILFHEAPLAAQLKAYAQAMVAPAAVPFEAVREELESRLPWWVKVRDFVADAGRELADWVQIQSPALSGPITAVAATEGSVGEALADRIRFVRGGTDEFSLVRHGNTLLLEWLGEGDAPSAVAVEAEGGPAELSPTSGPLQDEGAAYWRLDQLPAHATTPPVLVLRRPGGERRLVVEGQEAR